MNATFLVRIPAQGAEEPFRRSENEVLRVGRTRDGNDVSLPGDASLAGHHCEFFFRDNAWHVRDLDTDGGTQVDDEPVEEMVLVNGSTVRVGLAEIVYTPDAVTQPTEPTADEDDVAMLRPPSDLMGLADEEDEEVLKIVPPPGTPGREASLLLHGSGKRATIREIE